MNYIINVSANLKELLNIFSMDEGQTGLGL